MKTITLVNDVEIFYVTASSFPEGIPAAFDELEKRVSSLSGRKRYGISRPENVGAIVYKAAVAAEYAGEGKKYGCETMRILHGEYISIDVNDYPNHIMDIGCAFRDLLADPRIDPNGYCVEEYFNETDMRCIVRLDPKE